MCFVNSASTNGRNSSNVLVGTMSLVGPRPLVPLHAHAWTAEERRRLDAKPGMTGWQQVNGAATNTWEQRVALDLWYVDHWSLWLDLKILFRTPLVVIGATTVYGKDGVERSSIPTRVQEATNPAVSTGDASPSTIEHHRQDSRPMNVLVAADLHFIQAGDRYYSPSCAPRFFSAISRSLGRSHRIWPVGETFAARRRTHPRSISTM